jgi:hypothetical protein
MTAERAAADSAVHAGSVRLSPAGVYPGLRVLAWDGDVLYASRRYQLLRGKVTDAGCAWQSVGTVHPVWWRNLSSVSRLGFRLMRDGFHALAILPSEHLIGAVPGGIVTLPPDASEFHVSHRILRGTRPLHITATPEGRVFWGEYFDNAAREEVHIYGSQDAGSTWDVVYTFPRGAIRHVHNVVYDPWERCLWVLTGDYGAECRILRASCDFQSVDVVMSGNQQARAVAMVPTAEGLYFATDTPLEANFIYCMDRRGNLQRVADLTGSSIYGCSAGETVFFSTMVEPSAANPDRNVRVFGGTAKRGWQSLLAWPKDVWSMRFFQYGNAFLPDGRNTTDFLALTTNAVAGADLAASIYRVGG